MTRNVVLYELMSLDGFADDPGEGEWFGTPTEKLMEFLGDVIGRQDTVLLGRTTFEKWAPYWPTATMQPFADFINATPKLVFSSVGTLSRVGGYDARHRVSNGCRRQSQGAATEATSASTAASAWPASLLAEDLSTNCAWSSPRDLAGHGKRLFDGDFGLQRSS